MRLKKEYKITRKKHYLFQTMINAGVGSVDDGSITWSQCIDAQDRARLLLFTLND